MNLLLFRLWLKKTLRSVSFTRNLIWNIILWVVILFFLLNLMFIAFGLPFILDEYLNDRDPVEFLNVNMIYVFLMEFVYRFFIQRMPVFELENYLHLPIKRSQIVSYLIGRSFLSPFSLIILLIFTPFSVVKIGGFSGLAWLINLWVISLCMHAFVLWFKQRFGDALIGIASVAGVLFISIGANYYGYYNIGIWTAPFFNYSLNSVIPLAGSLILFSLSLNLAYSYYIKNAYTEELTSDRKVSYRGNTTFGILSRFGLAGQVAEAEWKLIIRHKKSRNYLIISILFLLYGLLFYGEDEFQKDGGIPWIYIFSGIFITGSFVIQYGQLFLSWNSNYFDFFMTRKNGIKALIEGKFLLLTLVSLMCFILTIPYLYFGWEVLFVNLGCLIFNLGVTTHVIINFALWKPKPMDLSKGALFNYEGVGIAQFMMAFPVLILPYLIYLPFSYLLSDYIGIVVLGALGVIGLILKDKILENSIRKVLRNKYQISASFRQEL